ncbi:MAG: DUF3332 family protein [Candidatus Sumerlaeota bacterium]|nr:DUF3332 family protein [Candidatus Sumerlaeota bacterium]
MTSYQKHPSFHGLRRYFRWTALVALLLFTPVATGCFGRFALTRGVYNFNGDVTDDKLAQTLVMWGLMIIPVYQIAALGDVFIFNLVEFWTGSTHIKVSQATAADGAEAAFVPSDDGSEAMLTISRGGAVLAVRQFVKQGDGSFSVLDERGGVAGGVVPTANGDILLTDANGNVVQTLTADELKKM